MSEPNQRVIGLAAVALSVGVVALVVWAGSALLSGTSDVDDAISTPTSTSEPRPVIGFDFSGAVSLGVDPDSGRVDLPDCFGRVERIAVVAEDARETYWEVVSSDGQGVVVKSFEIGEPLTGFDVEVALMGAGLLRGLIVVNGTDHLGLGGLGSPAPSGAVASC